MDSKEGVIIHLKRGLGYGLTSLFALNSGLIFKSHNFKLTDSFLLIIPFFLSIPFFIVYGFAYHYERFTKKLTDEAFILSTLLFIFISLSIGLTYNNFIDTLKISTIGVFFAFGLLFWAKALIIFLRKRNMHFIRYQLVWPSVLTIAISLYFGMNFSSLHYDYRAYIPILFVIIYYFMTEIFHFKKGVFFFSSIVALILIAIYVGISNLTSQSLAGQYFSSILFSIFTAGYLAVFESWRITSFIAKRENLINFEKNNSRNNNNSIKNVDNEHSQSDQYYLTTLLALSLSLIAIPFSYIFIGYGIIFLIGFVIHSLSSFFYWFNSNNSLLNKNWAIQKLIFGFLFLGILVIDSKFNIQPEKNIMKGFISYSGLGIILIVSVWITTNLFKEIRKCNEARSLSMMFTKIFSNKLNFIRLLALLSALMCFFILLIKDIETDNFIKYRSNYAYLFYAILVAISAFFEIKDQLIGKNSGLIHLTFYKFIGFMRVTRIFVSLIIGFIVFLPALVKELDVLTSLLKSLPFIFAAMGGFALNDFFDADRDAINKPYRTIPSGVMKAKSVLVWALLLLIFAVILTIEASGNIYEFILYLFAIIGVITYNLIVKIYALSKTIFTAIICSLPVFYVVCIFNYQHIYFLIPIATIVFIAGRELLMDIKDIEGDKKSGIITIPMKVKPKTVSQIAFILQFAALLLSIPVLMQISFPLNFIFLTLMLSISTILTIFWLTEIDKYQKRVIKFLWIPMILGILTLIL